MKTRSVRQNSPSLKMMTQLRLCSEVRQGIGKEGCGSGSRLRGMLRGRLGLGMGLGIGLGLGLGLVLVLGLGLVVGLGLGLGSGVKGNRIEIIKSQAEMKYLPCGL